MKINYSKQFIDKKDINLVAQSLKSELITQGSYVMKFENELKKYFKSKYCSAVSNGTAALYLSCRALGWKKGDTIITSPITFIASANSIEAVGARTELVDIDPDTNCLDLNKLETKIKKLKKKIKGIVAVDYAGQPCYWQEIKYICKKYRLKIINDNCHALGASYKGSKSYAAKYADIVCQSYHPVKNFTTGEGGSILTNDKNIYQRVNILKSHGIERDKKNFVYKKNLSDWYYEAQDISFNFRISDINCALGISQLKKLNKFVEYRKKVAMIYDKEFKNLEYILTPKKISTTSHAYHLYPIRIDFDKLKLDKKKFFNFFFKKNFKLQVHYIPIYMHPYFKKKYNYNLRDLMESYKFYKETVSIPNYYGLSKNQQYRFINLLKGYVSK